ncbi:MAG: hypothetical protein Q7J05_08045 [Paludibacter sp.]|nr:hypothetical protein [Paludibacter sp.]
MKTTIKTLLILAIIALAYFCFMSVMTPIRFERVRAEREKVVIQNLMSLRAAQLEHRDQKGYYTGDLDSLINFIKTGKKKMVLKEGTLSDLQLQAGLTEAKAVSIIRKGNKKEIAEFGLENFRRDTSSVSLIEALYGTVYNEKNIEKLKYIPFSEQVPFEVELNNNYVSSNNISIPLCEIRAPYRTFLFDVNRQEALNLIDLQEKMDKYPGIKVGAVTEPNNFAGNWE